MKYTLKQLAVFDAVASQESVSAAARKLSMTQSAVSMSLSQFENLMDRPLFIRQGNRLTLSHWGRWLRPKAKRLLQDAQQIELGLHDQQAISGSFPLSVSQTFAEHLLPSLISKIDTDFPELRIELTVENTEHVVNGVINHHYEMGIIEGRNDDSRVHQENLLEDHLVIISSAFHSYAKHKKVNLAQLEQAQWILREQGAGTRRIFDGAVHGLIENVDVYKEYQSVGVIKELVKNGTYLGCLPYLDVVSEVKKGTLVILPTPELNMSRSLAFIWRKDAGENPLRECIIAEAKRLIRLYKKRQNL
ncbi:LysR family transcriptional regulator [Psychromonas sp. psych-6C06]|uniref:LysR substrate-binding domain-containing protein n=1 Tax=Psychromonas sp. psych-6C06 TaxID=2058089 RepID=UPI000C32BABA|nr:LysR substrate-binding domain-containing protein [Psychromonas sp. psych-6C06]PKF63557.1 LysR family transcriptional regulator [Psychromonas sp. psych-6C06]